MRLRAVKLIEDADDDDGIVDLSAVRDGHEADKDTQRKKGKTAPFSSLATATSSTSERLVETQVDEDGDADADAAGVFCFVFCPVICPLIYPYIT